MAPASLMIALLCALLLVTVLPASAQPASSISDRFIHRAWDTADGLPQNSVTAIAQGPDGYLWLGTFGGLVRFDGTTFTVFVPANTPGLPGSRVVALHVDRRGGLWIATESGLSRYMHGEFTSYSHVEGFPAGGVRSVLEDRRGRIWAGADGGLVRIDGDRVDVIPIVGRVGGALALAETPDGAIWATDWSTVTRVTDGAPPAIVQRSSGAADSVRALLVDTKGRLWAGGSRGLQRWDGHRFVTEAQPRGVIVTALAEDAGGALWLGTWEHGVYVWRDGVIEGYSATGPLADVMVRSIGADRHGQVWIGTDVGGVIRLKPRHVHSYQRPGTTEQSIGPIVDDGDDGLWIGATCGGLYHFRAGVFRVYDMSDGVPHNCVWALHRDADGALWIGTSGGGLSRFAAGRFTNWTTADGISQMVFGLARLRDGRLWIGTDQGVSTFDGSRFTHHGADVGVPREVRAIYQDRGGTIWLGGPNGLARGQHGRFTTLTTADGLSNNHVRAIHEDADGVLWIGTYGGGLNRLKDGRFTAFTTREGLQDNAVSRIIEDDRGNLWMSGNKGVFRVARRQLNDLAEGRIAFITSVSYGVADGMIIDETNGGQPAGWRTQDGRLWFPTIKGLVSLEPSPVAATHPPIYVERTVLNGRDAEFHFTAVDLSAPEKTRFRYRLSGYDPRWMDSGDRRVAYYTNIPPGDYDFEVVATNSDGVWSEVPGRTSFQIAPFWWERRAVQGGALALLLLATGGIVRSVSLRRARARVDELMREQALERERSRIARDLHDDLGSRLSHIALMAAQTGTGSGEPLAAAARSAVQAMDELVWSVSARNDTIESFAYYVEQYVGEHVSAAGLRYRLLFPSTLPARPLPADTRRHLFLCVKEAVNNAIKHAAASEIRVSLEVVDGVMVLDVLDNGKGLAPSVMDPTGHGLSNFRDRMDAVGGRVTIESPPGRGTRLVFTVPLMAHRHALASSNVQVNTGRVK